MPELTKKDFYNAFRNCKTKDSQTGETLGELILNEGMDIAAEAAFELYQANLKELKKDAAA